MKGNTWWHGDYQPAGMGSMSLLPCLCSEVKALEDTRKQFNKAMQSSMPRDLANSLDAVARLARDHNVQ